MISVMVNVIRAVLNIYCATPNWVQVIIGISSLTFIGIMAFKAFSISEKEVP
jgi:adenosine/AMP kinase